MYRICKDCGTKVSYSMLERDVPDYCIDCNLVIAKGRYEKNIKGGKTLFSTIGEPLGHNVMVESLLRFYKEHNPDETVSLLPHAATLKFIENYKDHSGFDKLFWADVSGIEPPDDSRVIKYSFARECTAIAGHGYYPGWEEKKEPNRILPYHETLPNLKYIVLHARNIENNQEKNMKDTELFEILMRLENIIVVFVGNDEWLKSELSIINDIGYDFRNKLSLNEIAWLCGHNNCMATIGKDSGILHIAAAAGSNVVGFDYQSKHWFPKADPERVHCFMKTGGWNKFLDFIEKLA